LVPLGGTARLPNSLPTITVPSFFCLIIELWHYHCIHDRAEGISGASVTKPTPPGDHIPLGRRCAFGAPCRLNQRPITTPGAGTEDGSPPGVTKVGYVPVLKPVLRPFDDPVVAFPVVPVPGELPTLPEPAAPVAAAPLVPAPVPPPTAPPVCARAMDEVAARAEARAIVVSFMWLFPAPVKTSPREVASKGPSRRGGASGAVLGVVPLGEPAQT